MAVFVFPKMLIDLSQLKENLPNQECHCEPVTDVTGVAIPRLDGNLSMTALNVDGDCHVGLCPPRNDMLS